MNKIVSLFLFLFLCLYSKSQISLVFRSPGGGLIPKEQLLSFIVTSSSNVSEVSFIGQLQSKKTGESLAILTGEISSLQKGATIIGKSNINNLFIDNISNVFNNQYLPFGTYIYCIQLTQSTTKGVITLTKECFAFEIDAFSPPILIFPENGAIIQNPKPNFQWLPPQPVQTINNIRYEFNLMEVKEEQKPQEALKDNFPLYNNNFLTTNSTNLLSSIEGLKDKTKYAWQVKAFNEQGNELLSEIWSFTYKLDTVESIINNAPFIKTKINGTDFGVLQQGVIKLSYDNQTSDTLIEIQIVEDNKANAKVQYREKVNITRNNNYIELRTENKIKMDERKQYIIFFRNRKNELFSFIAKPKYYR